MLGVMEARLNKDDHGFLQVEKIMIEKQKKFIEEKFFLKKIKNSIDFQ
jgi:hypothetical protein